MTEIGPHHHVGYRQEIVTPLFQHIQACDSTVIVGAASMGKSRLLQFIIREEVRQHYLNSDAAKTLMIWADCNRMAEISEWGLYELLLTSLTETCGGHPLAGQVRHHLNDLRREAIVTRNALLAQRHLELAIHMLCKEHDLQLCILFDEFDESYLRLQKQALANLRALRDANKYKFTYILFLRTHPAKIRPTQETEGFYELFSRSILGLQPYSEVDARRVLEQLQARRSHELYNLPEPATEHILRLSGGHPGLIVALLDGYINHQPLGMSWEMWAQQQPSIQEELRKLWAGLPQEERQTLHHLAQGLSTSFRDRQSLLIKGMIREVTPQNFMFFTPLLRAYSASESPTSDAHLHFDKQTGMVSVNGYISEALTAKEFDLVDYLYAHVNQVCEPRHIIESVYPGDEGINITDNAVAALVGRVRKKIEPNPQRPQFLLNIKGRGYKLVTALDVSE